MNENLTDKSSNVKKNDAPEILNLPKTGLKPKPRPKKRKAGITLNSYATTAEPEPELPENFVLNDNGLWYNGDKWIYICSPLQVIAYTCDVENNQWGRLLEFEDQQKFKHSLSVPMSSLSSDGAECRARLMDCGLIISPSNRARQLLLQYILEAKPKKHVLCVNQLGWHDDAFVLPDEVISANEGESQNEKELLLQNVDRTANKFKPSGSLTEWQDNIARYCVGNSRLMFAVCTAFAAALLPIAEETSGGFHLHGTSSTGKTTALEVAGSVWGGDRRKGFLETWRATSNGLEAVAESHNHSLLLLDEISQVNAYDVGEVVYSLSNGFGKSRMNKNTTARRKTEWNLLFFSSGEETLEQKMQTVGQKTKGGQEARFVNIEADANAGLGLFEELHGFESPNDLAKFLSSASKRFYGEAIREFLQKVCDNRSFVEETIKKMRQFYKVKFDLDNPKIGGEVNRVASRFALVTIAGILSGQFGVTNWKSEDVLACGEKIFDEWLKLRGTTGSFDTTQGVKQVLSFIAQHGASRFQSVNDTTARIQNRAGFKRENYDGQTEYLILPEIFEGEICKGFSPIAVAKELEKLGHLKRGSEKKYIQAKASLPELGQKRVYVIVYEALSENEAET